MLTKKLFATVVPVMGLALVASAQSGGSQGGTQRGSESGQTGQEKPGDTTGRGAMPEKSGTTMARLTLVNANDVIGMKVTNSKGEQIGKIEDVIIHPRGEIAYAVLSITDSDKLHTIPWSVLQSHGAAKGADAATGETRAIILPIEKDRLKTAPGFAKGQWPDMKNPEWSRDVEQFYAADKRGRAVEASSPRTAGQPIWRASDLKGAKVETPTGDNLGDIKEVIIDQDGRVSMVILSVGGFLGMGDRLVATPFEALKPATDPAKAGKSFTLATTKDRLKEAPEFKTGKENWSGMTDPAYVGRVYEFYSVRPYWSTDASGANRR